MIRGCFFSGRVGRIGVVFVVEAFVTVGVDNLVVLTIVLVAIVGFVDAREGVGLGVVLDLLASVVDFSSPPLTSMLMRSCVVMIGWGVIFVDLCKIRNTPRR